MNYNLSSQSWQHFNLEVQLTPNVQTGYRMNIERGRIERGREGERKRNRERGREKREGEGE